MQSTAAHTCQGSNAHSLVLPCRLLGRLIGSDALYMRPRLPPPLLLLPSLLLLSWPSAGEPLRHLLPMASLLRLLVASAASSSAITSSNVSIAASGLPLLFPAPLLELLLLPLVLEVLLAASGMLSKSWVRMNHFGNCEFDLFTHLQELSFRS